MKELKILFLMHNYPNYVPDLLLHGFRKLFGTNVVEYPLKETLYRGQMTGTPDETEFCPDLFDIPADKFDRNDIPAKIRMNYFDLVFCDIRAFEFFRRLQLPIPKNFVLIDGEDQPVFSIPIDKYVILRRETDGTDYSIPLQMALPEEILQKIVKYDGVEKKYLIGFLGSVDSAYSERKEIIQELAESYPNTLFSVTEIHRDANNKPTGRLGREDYYKALQSCEVVLNFRGAGWDTFRYWENAACNAIHLSQKLKILIPNDFEEETHIFRFENIVEIKRKLDFIIENREMWNIIKFRTRDHLLNYHLTDCRALFVLDKLKYFYEF